MCLCVCGCRLEYFARIYFGIVPLFSRCLSLSLILSWVPISGSLFAQTNKYSCLLDRYSHSRMYCIHNSHNKRIPQFKCQQFAQHDKHFTQNFFRKNGIKAKHFDETVFKFMSATTVFLIKQISTLCIYKLCGGRCRRSIVFRTFCL